MKTRILMIVMVALIFQAWPAQGAEYERCRFDNFTVPDDALVYVAAAYGGVESGMKITGEGSPAGVMTVAVNSPDRPVVLLLSAYNPTMWHIGWTAGTKILAVAASGYHTQIVTGPPPDAEVLVKSYSKEFGCPQFKSVTLPVGAHNTLSPEKIKQLPESKEIEKANQFSQQLTGRLPDGLFGETKPGRILVGPYIPADQPIFTANEINRTEIDNNWPLDDFLLTSVRQNRIRPATAKDYVQWVEAQNKANGKHAKSIIVPSRLTSEVPWRPVWAYRIVDEEFFRILAETLPKVIGGSRQDFVVFFLPPGLEATDPVGGAILLNLDNGTCLGHSCGDKHLSIIKQLQIN